MSRARWRGAVVGQDYMVDRLPHQPSHRRTCPARGSSRFSETLTVRTLAETIDTRVPSHSFYARFCFRRTCSARRCAISPRDNSPSSAGRSSRTSFSPTNQSRAGQGAGRAARGDAGKTGDDRRNDVQARGAVLSFATQNPIEQEERIRFPRRRSIASCSSCASAIRRATKRRSCAEWRAAIRSTCRPSHRRRRSRGAARIRVAHGRSDHGLHPPYALAVVADRAVGGEFTHARGVEDRLARPRVRVEPERAHAFLRGRAFVTPDDVKAIAPDVLRHRVLTTYEAEAEDVTSEQIVARVLAKIESP